MSKLYDALTNIENNRKACVATLEKQGMTIAPDANMSTVADKIKSGVSGEGAFSSDPVTYSSYAGNIRNYIKIIDGLNTSQLGDFSSLFEGCTRLETIIGLDTSKATRMGCIFSKCNRLKEIPQLNTSKVTTIYEAFFQCKSITKMPPLDLTKCKSLQSLFEQDDLLETVEELKTSDELTDVRKCFAYCKNLKNVVITDTSAVKVFYNMLCDCSNLIVAPTLNVGSATNMDGMFSKCLKIQEIDISLAPILPNCSLYDTFYEIPADCLIKVYDEASKQKVLSSRSDLTNIVVTGGK